MINTGTRPPWAEKPSRTLALAKFIVLLITVLLVLYPLVTVLSTSLSSELDVQAAGGMVLYPQHPNLNAYRSILHRGIIEHAILVSVIITALTSRAGKASRPRMVAMKMPQIDSGMRINVMPRQRACSTVVT